MTSNSELIALSSLYLELLRPIYWSESHQRHVFKQSDITYRSICFEH